MAYTCGVCDETVEGDLVDFQQHTEAHIVDVIKAKHPGWVDGNGVCQKCLEYYKKQLKGEG